MNSNTESLSKSGGHKGTHRQWMTANPFDYELLKANARKNRNNMTEAESAFWAQVRDKALGQRCIRQHVIGEYIVDFLFRKSKVVVEIDGEYHFTEEQQREDSIRTTYLEQVGYRVIRFTNKEVLLDTNNVINKIKEQL